VVAPLNAWKVFPVAIEQLFMDKPSSVFVGIQKFNHLQMVIGKKAL